MIFLLIPGMIPYLGKGSLWTGIRQGSSNDIILLFWVFFLGHPKYPNTVDTDRKAHKEDMMHRPKWRGTFTHSRTAEQSLYRRQQMHSPQESTAFCTARSQNWESILVALYVRIYVNLLSQFPKMNAVTKVSNLKCSTTAIWSCSLLCIEYSFIT